ncbi:MAG: hypothetical protein RPU90_01955 [Candidatus Sedimenticola sp. (ex Thyasira tokunagai)]
MPSKDVIEKVLGSIKRRADYDYFFSKIESPDWIVPLREYGLFSNPPPVEREGNYLHHQNWPESKYLLRMAKQAPVEVTESVLSVPETNNERVHEDFVQAAIIMPSEHAVKIAKVELKWIKAQDHFYFLYPEYVGKLISHLAKSGKIRISYELAKALLDISRIEREIGSPGDDGYHKSVEIVAKFSTWQYGRVLKKRMPDPVEASGMPVFEMLCELLDKSMALRSDHAEPPHDYSWIWRSAIEEHEQNSAGRNDIQSFLVDAIRDAALQLVKANESILSELVATLESRAWLIFKRISMYLLSQFPRIQPELVAERLTNHDLFEDEGFRYEYAQLARAAFGSLSPDQQTFILSWIEEGPDIDGFKSRVLESKEREATDDEVRRRIKVWQRDNLDQFKESLQKDWKQRFDALVQELGEAEHQEFAYYSKSWVGPTSPKSVEELKEMPVCEVVEYLKAWVPPEGDMNHSPEGLSRTLADVVSTEPTPFATEARLFKELGPTYVRGLLDGLRDAPKSHADLPWEPVLDLCLWIVNQPRTIPGRKTEYSGKDPGWMWARKSIAKLLSNGMKSVSGEIQVDLRPQVWNVILPLTDDPDPTDEEYGEGHMDPSTLSINTVRGEAMHSVVDFGLWVYRHASEDKVKGFDLMPEVREVLDKHLDTDLDASLAIRSVYGQWFPWLILIDSTWAEQVKERIFFPDSPQYWDTAWKTYVTFCQPYDDVLAVLRDQYALAIEKVGQPSTMEIDMANAEERLADHLMIYFWRGRLKLDDPLVQSFYARATNAMKAHAIEFLGRSLRDLHVEPPVEVHERLKSLWAWRYQQATQSEGPDELAGFCWWFSSGKMDVDWALSQLKAVLSLPIKLDALDFAAEELVKLISEKPLAVLKCVNLMINHLGSEGVYFGWNEEAKQILGEAMKQENETVIAQATDIIHQLGAMGHFEFRTLL